MENTKQKDNSRWNDECADRHEVIQKGTIVFMPSTWGYIHSSAGSMNLCKDTKIVLKRDTTAIMAWEMLNKKYTKELEAQNGSPKEYFFKGLTRANNGVHFLFGT